MFLKEGFNMSLASVVTRLIDDRSYASIGRMAGISGSYVSNIAQGKSTDPRRSAMKGLATAFEMEHPEFEALCDGDKVSVSKVKLHDEHNIEIKTATYIRNL